VWSEGKAAILMCHRPLIDHCRFPIGWSLHVQEATCNAIPHDARGARDRAKAPSIRGSRAGLVTRKFCKIFQISRHIESLGTYMKH
jgi:hypothetical protein